MTNLQVPLWCRTLIEQSTEAYFIIENDKVAFLNDKALSILQPYMPDTVNCLEIQWLWKNGKLNLITENGIGEIETIDKDSVELLYTEEAFQLFKMKECSKNRDYQLENDQCYFSLFNTVKDAIFIQDREGVILEANQGAEMMYGYPTSYFKGKMPAAFSVYAPGDVEQNKISLAKAFKGEPQKLEFWGKRSNGEIFPKEIHLYKGVFLGKDVVIALTTDISDRKQKEAQFDAYTMQLQELVETRDKIYSIVAHDLRSSFSSILGLSELLTEDWELIEDHRKQIFARNIFIAADGSFKLLQNLLDWSKNQSGILEYDPVTFDMCGVINETLSLYRLQSTQKNIALHSEITSPTFVFADVNMTQSILRNLISNAIKFTPENGKVWVTCCEKEDVNLKKMVCLSVHDVGVGISQERIKKLFESKINSTTLGTANEQGTGLGILICKEMAEKNHGKLWIDSEVGKGSVFSFTLPMTKQ